MTEITRMPTVLFAGKETLRDDYARHLDRAQSARGINLRLVLDPAEIARAEVDYVIYSGNGPLKDLTPYPNLRAILNLWAGVEEVLTHPMPEDVPLVRMIEPGLTLGMIDYVVAHTLRHHMQLDQFIGRDATREWELDAPPLARDRTVGILGLGALGQECGKALAGLGFRVLGWSRSRKDAGPVESHAGEAGLDVVLARSEILVLLLPQTPDTTGILGASAIARMPRGACVINAGRGPLIDDPALIAALDRGHLAHATLDVFDTEPLPSDHAFWDHPKVTVTPHIASITRAETASDALVANIARDLAGEPMIGVVDRAIGY
ncbi:MAG: glyoxylate/hydroxypyruvate reductase A [Pseudomonadota bacterium]